MTVVSPRRGRRIVGWLVGTCLLAGGLVGVGTIAAVPASATAPRVACTWIQAGGDDNRANTTVCTKPGKPATNVRHRDCWKFEPPATSVVRRKNGPRWPATDIQVKIVRSKDCPESHPWLTVVNIPTFGLTPFVTHQYRLVMPAHEIEVDGETRTVEKATLNMFVCIVREGVERTCP